MTPDRGLARWSGLWLLAALLAACAVDPAYRDGMSAIEAGRWEEGLARLEEAAKRRPEDHALRMELLRRREHAVSQLLAVADAHRAAGRLDEAEALYRRVLGIEREQARASAGLRAVDRDRRHADAVSAARALLAAGDSAGAQARLQPVLVENPAHARAKALQRELDQAAVRQSLGPPRLDLTRREPVTLQFRDADIKMVFEALSRSTGINFILDKDIRSDGKTTIFVRQIYVDEAIDLILSQHQLAKKVLGENTVFVYPNTPAKLKDYEDQVIKSFYLTNADAKQAMNLLKTMLNSKVLFVDEKANMLVMRDTPEAVRMADKLIAALDLPEPEVMMEVEVLEVKRSRLTQLGINYPDQVVLAPAGATSGTLTVEDLRNLNGSRILVSPLSVGVDLKREVGETNVLANPRIRARNREKAQIHIGERVPVITNTTTPTPGGAVVTGSVQYVDVGLKLDVEPTVYLDDDVAIKVALEVSSIVREIVTASGTVAYQIGTRNASTLLRLKDGETQILAGLISEEERSTADRLPGLGDLPILGRLFSTHRDDAQKTEIVLSITPQIVRNLDRPDARTGEFWFGTEANMRSGPLAITPVERRPPEARPVETAGKPPAPAESRPAAGAPAGAVLAWSAPEEVASGQPFQALLLLEKGELHGEVVVEVAYDPRLLELIALRPGEITTLFEAGFETETHPETGRAVIRLVPPAPGGLRGEGGLAVFAFRPVAPQGQTSIAVNAPTADGLTVPAPYSLSITAQ